MKTLPKHIFRFAIVILPNVVVGEEDPFAEPPQTEIYRTGDRKSDKVLTDRLLNAFEEERLDQGTGKVRQVIRITIPGSFHAPLIGNGA